MLAQEGKWWPKKALAQDETYWLKMTLAQDMGSSSKLASIEEIERVWFELQREMTESGKVTKFTTDVVEAGGAKVSKEVVRVGPFALVADGKYLLAKPARPLDMGAKPKLKNTVKKNTCSFGVCCLAGGDSTAAQCA